MQVVPLSEVLGVELVDFDINRPCSPEEQAELRRLLCDHHLLAIRGHDLTDEDQSRFVGYFGPLHVKASGETAGYVSNVGDRMIGTGTSRLLWHADGTYGPRPGIATSLWAQQASPDSAPTLFANTVRALEQLPAELRTRVEGLSAEHMKDNHVERTDQRFREEDIPADAPPGRFVRHEQPIVYQLPHCGTKVLFVNELMTSHVVGLPREEGEALLQELFSRLYADDNVYTHKWRMNDLIIWDNMALQHCRPVEMGSAPRHLRRQTLDGWITDDGVLDWRETVVAFAGGTPDPPAV